jgi:hypothetical protein
MKTSPCIQRVVVVCLSVATGRLLAANSAAPTNAPGASAFRPMPTGPHTTLWSRVDTSINGAGIPVLVTNSYVQIESGLNVGGPNGPWSPASAQFSIVANGAVATNLAQPCALAANPNTAYAVQLHTPDGRLLASHVHGLAYYDSASGQSVLLAQLQNTTGLLIATNQVVYTNAFDAINADIRITINKSAFEQDVILRQAVPAPETFGLSTATTSLEVWTEFDAVPTPNLPGATIVTGASGTTATLNDSKGMDWGTMQMGTGRTFRTSDPDDVLALTAKHWVTTGGRQFLVESVPLTPIAAGLQPLPAAPGHGQLRKAARNRMEALLSVPAKDRKSLNAGTPIRKAKPEEVASIVGRPGLVVDPVTINSTLSNYTFLGDTTYSVTGPVILSGASAVFEGGAVLKFQAGVNASITANVPITWGGSIYRPVVFTGADDPSSGQSITSNPFTGTYATTALQYNAAAAGAPLNIAHARFCNAQTAIGLANGTGSILSHIQIVNCPTAFSTTSADFSLLNALVTGATTVFTGSGSTGRLEHITVDSAATFNNNAFTAANLTVKNSILCNVTTPGAYTAYSPTSVVTPANPGTVFQTAGGGSHYLAAGSSYVDAGTPSINANLALDFRSMTTFPPQTMTTPVGVSTTWNPQAPRDVDIPNLGYHYPALDYLVAALPVNAPLLITNGVAVGFSGTTGFSIANGGSVTSFGLANNLNRFTPVSTVQETPQALISNTASFTVLAGSANVGQSLRFTDVSFLAASTSGRNLYASHQVNGTATFRDVFLRGVYWNYYSYAAMGPGLTISMNNVYCERCNLNWSQGYSSTPYYLTLLVQNVLLNRSTLNLWRATTFYGTWQVTDNLFDTSTIALNFFPSYNSIDTIGNNGFLNTTHSISGANDITGLVEDFQVGPLGKTYYPTSGGAGSTYGLIDQDATTRTPATAGLYHHTTRSDLVT